MGSISHNYQVVTGKDLGDLGNEVQKFIEGGWIPQGGMTTIHGSMSWGEYSFVSSSHSKYSGSETVKVSFAQAMYKPLEVLPEKPTKTTVKD